MKYLADFSAEKGESRVFQNIVILLLSLAIVLPIGAFYIGARKANRFKSALFINITSFFGILIVATVLMFSGNVFAQEAASAVVSGGATTGDGLKFLGAALSTGLATVGAGIATGSAASSALGALSENEAIMGKALIFVALAEGIAIYGMLISFMILNA